MAAARPASPCARQAAVAELPARRRRAPAAAVRAVARDRLRAARRRDRARTRSRARRPSSRSDDRDRGRVAERLRAVCRTALTPLAGRASSGSIGATSSGASPRSADVIGVTLRPRVPAHAARVRPARAAARRPAPRAPRLARLGARRACSGGSRRPTRRPAAHLGPAQRRGRASARRSRDTAARRRRALLSLARLELPARVRAVRIEHGDADAHPPLAALELRLGTRARPARSSSRSRRGSCRGSTADTAYLDVSVPEPPGRRTETEAQV